MRRSPTHLGRRGAAVGHEGCGEVPDLIPRRNHQTKQNSPAMEASWRILLPSIDNAVERYCSLVGAHIHALTGRQLPLRLSLFKSQTCAGSYWRDRV